MFINPGDPIAGAEEFLKGNEGIALVALATVLGGFAPLVSAVLKALQVRAADRIVSPRPAAGATKITVPPLARAPAGDFNIQETTSRSVRFGVMPYVDHTQAFIAQRLAWFEEAGIRPTFRRYTPDDGLDALERGEIDVLSITPSALIKRGANPHGIKAFVLHDLFVGFGLMTRRRLFPGAFQRVRSYRELRDLGRSHNEALAQIAMYVSGRRVTHAKDDAILPFLSRIQSAAPDARPFRHVQAKELQTVMTMVKGKADFQVGGTPSRLTLEKLKFRSLISSMDLLEHGALMENSAEYLGLIQCGWFASGTWLEQNPDLALRMASVSYRITKFIVDDPRLAARIQVDYLNDIADTVLDENDLCRAYQDLHPFKTFEAQTVWFQDEADPFYVPTVTRNIIEYWRTAHPSFTFENLATPDDIIVAGQLHARLAALRRACVARFQTLETERASPEQAADLRAAGKFFSSYNYMDCLRLLDRLAACPADESPERRPGHSTTT